MGGFGLLVVTWQVLDDTAGVWSALDHTMGVHGHKRVGLSNTLSGAEDHLVTREAGVFWQELQMASVRSKEVEDIQARVRAGNLWWNREHVESLVEPWPDADMGTFQEGLEVEGVVEEGELLWDADDQLDMDSDDCAEKVVALAMSDAAAAAPMSEALAKSEVQVEAGDDIRDVADAQVYASRMESLEKTLTHAVAAGLHSVQWYVKKEMQRVRVSHFGGGPADRACNAVLRRHLAAVQDAQDKRVQVARRKSRIARAKTMSVKLAAHRLKVAALTQKEAFAARARALNLLPKNFSSNSLGQGKENGGGKEHLENRRFLLERLRLRSPGLPADLEAQWAWFVPRYAAHYGKLHGKTTGIRAYTEAKELLADLGEHRLPDGSGKASAMSTVAASATSAPGNAAAFELFVRKRLKLLQPDPKAANVMSV